MQITQVVRSAKDSMSFKKPDGGEIWIGGECSLTASLAEGEEVLVVADGGGSDVFLGLRAFLGDVDIGAFEVDAQGLCAVDRVLLTIVDGAHGGYDSLRANG